MGLFNQTCTLTGLEIREDDDAYLAVISRTAGLKGGHWIVTPPVRGIYADHGAILLDEDVPALEMEKAELYGADLPDEHVPIFINADVFHALGDFPSTDHQGRTTIRDAVDGRVLDLRNDLRSLTQPIEGAVGRVFTLFSSPFTAITLSNTFKDRELFWNGASDAMGRALSYPEDIENVFELYRRGVQLKIAENEFRRPFAITQRFPQPGTDAAVLALSQLTSTIAEKRINQGLDQ